MEMCPACGKKKMMLTYPAHNGTDQKLWRCPQHHFFTLAGEELPEPGTQAWRDHHRPTPAEPAKKATRKRAAKKAD